MGRDASIIGRLDFHSEMLFYANILVGNTSLCLDIGKVTWFESESWSESYNMIHITLVKRYNSYVKQLAWEEKANFDHLVTIRPETVFICTNRMYQDLGKLLTSCESKPGSLGSWLVQKLSGLISLVMSAFSPTSIW